MSLLDSQVPVLRVQRDGKLAVRHFLSPLLAVLRALPYGHLGRAANDVGRSPSPQGV